MKKIFAIVLALILVIGCVSLAEDSPLAGGWVVAEEHEITEDVMKVFETAASKLVGCAYEPIAVLGTQVVAGTNYCLLIKSTPVYPGAAAKLALMYIYADLQGDANVLDICDVNILADTGAGLAGGWTVSEETAVSEELAAAFASACEALSGVNYTPVAVLGTQVVAGINYKILAKASVVYPGAMPGWTVVTLYKGVDGTNEVLDVEGISPAPAIDEYEEEEFEGQNPVMNIIGSYMDSISQRASMTVECAGVSGAHVQISWANSAFETIVWDICGEFDTETNTIRYENALRTRMAFAEDGSQTDVIESSECAGTLMVTEDWHILWTDYDSNVNGPICDFEFIYE